MAYWSADVYTENTDNAHALVKPWYFCDENGYSDEHIKAIRQLEVGESMIVEEGHIITRVE